mmetsp:Transcript_30784/g.89932  ORF Transcript_30784/g.89932 Transcript_30784/m.89932 type:complete len:204 (+) Transcript_30784:428-1039(+)
MLSGTTRPRAPSCYRKITGKTSTSNGSRSGCCSVMAILWARSSGCRLRLEARQEKLRHRPLTRDGRIGTLFRLGRPGPRYDFQKMRPRRRQIGLSYRGRKLRILKLPRLPMPPKLLRRSMPSTNGSTRFGLKKTKRSPYSVRPPKCMSDRFWRGRSIRPDNGRTLTAFACGTSSTMVPLRHRFVSALAATLSDRRLWRPATLP